jgi:hypothetical protein
MTFCVFMLSLYSVSILSVAFVCFWFFFVFDLICCTLFNLVAVNWLRSFIVKKFNAQRTLFVCNSSSTFFEQISSHCKKVHKWFSDTGGARWYIYVLKIPNFEIYVHRDLMYFVSTYVHSCQSHTEIRFHLMELKLKWHFLITNPEIGHLCPTDNLNKQSF